MVKLKEKGDKEHLLNLRFQLVSEIDPFHSSGAALQIYHLEYNRKVMKKNSGKIEG